MKTVGIVEPLRQALAPIESAIGAAFVFGSVAKGEVTASNDVDVLVVSDSFDDSEVFEAFQAAEGILVRPVRPTVLSSKEWRKQRGTRNSFAERVATQPRLFVVGSESDIS